MDSTIGIKEGLLGHKINGLYEAYLELAQVDFGTMAPRGAAKGSALCEFQKAAGDLAKRVANYAEFLRKDIEEIRGAVAKLQYADESMASSITGKSQSKSGPNLSVISSNYGSSDGGRSASAGGSGGSKAIYQEDLDTFLVLVRFYHSRLQPALNAVKESVRAFCNSSSFSGSAADAIMNYMNCLHPACIGAFSEAVDTLLKGFIQYRGLYARGGSIYETDADEAGIYCEEYLKGISDNIQREMCDGYTTPSYDALKNAKRARDGAPINYDLESLEGVLKQIRSGVDEQKKKILKLRSNVSSAERQGCAMVSKMQAMHGSFMDGDIGRINEHSGTSNVHVYLSKFTSAEKILGEMGFAPDEAEKLKDYQWASFSDAEMKIVDSSIGRVEGFFENAEKDVDGAIDLVQRQRAGLGLLELIIPCAAPAKVAAKSGKVLFGLGKSVVRAGKKGGSKAALDAAGKAVEQDAGYIVDGAFATKDLVEQVSSNGEDGGDFFEDVALGAYGELVKRGISSGAIKNSKPLLLSPKDHINAGKDVGADVVKGVVFDSILGDFIFNLDEKEQEAIALKNNIQLQRSALNFKGLRMGASGGVSDRSVSQDQMASVATGSK